jgi:hypothetical protein
LPRPCPDLSIIGLSRVHALLSFDSGAMNDRQWPAR